MGSTDLLLDKAILNRIVEVQKLSEKDQEHLFVMMDAFHRDAKTRKVYAS